MKYCVYLTALQYGSVQVEADSDDQAVQEAKKLYEQGRVFWHDGELSDISPQAEIPTGKIVAARPVNGITINGELELLLDDDGNVRVFDSEEQAKEFLIAVGVGPEELRHIVFMKN